MLVQLPPALCHRSWTALAGSRLATKRDVDRQAVGLAADQGAKQVEALWEQARESTYLFEASAELGRTLDLEESAQTAAEAIFGLGGVAYVVILTGHSELGPFTAAAVRGLPPEIAAQVHGHEYAVPLWGVMARALVGRQPVVIDDVAAQSHPRPDEFNWDTRKGSMLLYPVCGASGPVALLILGASQAGALARGRPGDLVFALSSIASHSIQNAFLYGEVARSQAQLVTPQMITQMGISSRLEDVVEAVVREATEMLGDSHVWMFLSDAGGEAKLCGQSTRTAAEDWTESSQEAVNTGSCRLESRSSTVRSCRCPRLRPSSTQDGQCASR